MKDIKKVVDEYTNTNANHIKDICTHSNTTGREAMEHIVSGCDIYHSLRSDGRVDLCAGTGCGYIPSAGKAEPYTAKGSLIGYTMARYPVTVPTFGSDV
jgi:hypothetical protein